MEPFIFEARRSAPVPAPARVAVVCVGVLSCVPSQQTEAGADDSPIVAVAADSPTDAVQDGAVVDGPLCPASPPQVGTPCQPPTSYALVCEYGGNGYRACPVRVACESPGVWSSNPPAGAALTCDQDASACSCDVNLSGCPVTYPDGGACEPGAFPVNCDYPEGRCVCGGCSNDSAATGGLMECRPWSDVGSACPTPRPLLGSPCPGREGTYCFYDAACGGISLGPSMWCSGGRWIWFPGGGGSCDAYGPACP